MNNRIQPNFINNLGDDVSLFVSLGDLKAIVFMNYRDHSLRDYALVPTICTVVGVLGIVCLCCSLAKVVFNSCYKKLSKKGF